MRGGTVQINWHDTKPVLTLDFHPISGILATGGADFDIKLWLINSGGVEKKVPAASYQNSLSYHGSAVNALRFSPSGEQLASGADGGELILWKLHSTDAGQAWKVLKTLAFHHKDVLDVQWSTDGAFLISGSVDNSCIIWDVNKGSVHQILDAHFHYVQGVAWDPLAMYAASLSSDRSCRIYVNKPTKMKGIEKMNYVCQHVITKVDQQIVDNSKSAKSHLFHDETLPSFFRRLSWSPEGTFLLVPAGSYKFSPVSEPVNTAYVFSRKDLSRPALMLPGASKPVVAVRFCPKAFCLRGSTTSAFFKLPYRLIFAVATLNSLYIYDTESVQPIVVLAGIHYAAITDISWSPTGKYLALSSQDGYCTLLEFEDDELGSSNCLPEEKKVSGNEKNIPLKKPEDTRTEATSNNNPKSRNAEAEKSDGKPALPAETKEEKHASPGETNKEKQASTASTNDEKQASPAETNEEKQASPAETNEEKQTLAPETIEHKQASAPETTEEKQALTAKTSEEKQAPPNLVGTPAPNKPAKRRITPMAID